MHRTIGNVNVLPSSSSEDRLLETLYYCKVQDEKVDVVMELSASDKLIKSSLPERYVLTIDVSVSMDSPVVENDNRSLLERMKAFAHLFIDHASSHNFVAIVSFSGTADICLPMTRMNQEGKRIARRIIDHLHTIGNTNLSEALTTSLEVTWGPTNSYDCIILFTDGNANAGIVDPVNLVNAFKEKTRMLNRINQVQLACITIGDYQPKLLKEIAERLSGDAFYWLDLSCDFEADMLIPKFLREYACISDITIDLTCMKGVTIVPNSQSTSGLQELYGNYGMKYFIYNLPKIVRKRTRFTLDISYMNRGQNVMMQVNKSYLDHQLAVKEDVDHLLLSLISMREVAPPSVGEDVLTHLERMYAYVCRKDVLMTSFEDAQQSYACVMEQQCHDLAISSVKKSINLFDENNEGISNLKDTQYNFRQTVRGISNIKNEAALVLGKLNPHYKTFQRNVNQYSETLELTSRHPESLSWVRLSAMESSLSMQMPAASGVFPPELPQAYMPPQVEDKLFECTKGINEYSGNKEAARKMQEEYEWRKNRLESQKQLLEAMSNRDADAIADALLRCRDYKVGNDDIKDGEDFHEIVKEEDQLIIEIKELMERRNSSELEKAINYFKSSKYQFVDKTGDFKRAEKLLEELIKKEKLQRELNESIDAYEEALRRADLNVMEEMIEKIKGLASQGADVDADLIVNAEADLKRVEIEIKYRQRMDEIQANVSNSLKDENLLAMDNWIEKLKSCLEDKKFSNVDKYNETQFLEINLVNMKNLRKKQSIQNDLRKLKELQNIPLVPESLENLQNGIDQIEKLKVDATGLVGVFTEQDEDFFKAIYKNTSVLQKNIEERDDARWRLKEAIEERNYNQLVETIKYVSNAPFIEDNDTRHARDLADFLNPTNRINALQIAYASRDLIKLSAAIEDFQNANVACVSGDDLLRKSEDRLNKLIKLKIKEEKEERKRQRKEAKRQQRITELNNLLEDAMHKEDLSLLASALNQCEEETRIDNEDVPLYKEAKQMAVSLTIKLLRSNLLQAMNERNIEGLEEALLAIETNGYVEELKSEYTNGQDLLLRLLELRRLKESILKLDKSKLAEIQRYPAPPIEVFVVMKAALTLLGEQKKTIEKWSNVQKILGQTGNQSIVKRIVRQDPADVDNNTCRLAQQMLEGADSDKVRQISKVAEVIYSWILCMILESQYSRQEEE